jgi:hypothetical protein
MSEPTTETRLALLEAQLRQLSEEVGDQGATVDHLVNTQDSMLLPTQRLQADQLARHEVVFAEARDLIASQRGVWQFVTRFGVAVAAIASFVTLVYKLKGQ